MSDEPIAAVVDQVARTLSRPAVEALASALARTQRPDAEARRTVLAAVPVGVYAAEAARLLEAWAEHAPGHPGPAVALALRAAACAVDTVVASRPSTSSGPARPPAPCPCG